MSATIEVDWPPPDERRAEHAKNKKRVGPENPVLLRTRTVKITRKVPEWQQGVSPILITAVAAWRLARPSTALPGWIQKKIARAWIEAAL